MRIRVTLLTARYIAFEYANSIKDNVYQIPPSEELYQQLFFMSNTETSKKLSDKEAATSIDIEVKSLFLPLINPDVIGLRLHRFVKIEMCRDVALMLASDIKDKTAIKSVLQFWLKMRGIEDEEFSIETAVKTFFRFRQINLNKIQRNMSKSCTPFVPSSCNVLTHLYHQNYEDILRGYIADNEAYFLTKRKKPHTRRIKQARCFIMRKVGYLTPQMIAKKTLIPKRTVQHAIRKFDLFLQTKPNLPFPKA